MAATGPRRRPGAGAPGRPFDPDVAYAATLGGGLFRSADGGRSWERWSEGLADAYVMSLAAGPDGTIFAGMLMGGVFRRRERGSATWEPGNGGLPLRFHPPCGCHSPVFALAADPVSGALYAGLIGHTVYRSADHGETWTGVADGITGSIGDLAVDPRGSLYISVDNALYRSDDGGNNVVRLLRGLQRQHLTAVVFDPSSPNTVYAATLDGVLKSTDRGKTWRPVRAGLRNRKVVELTIDPQRPRTLYASTLDGGLYRTEDGGGRWRRAGRGLPAHPANALLVNGGSVLAGMGSASVYFATGPAVFRSADRGARWHRSDTGITALSVGSVAFAQGTVFAGTAGQGLLRQEGAGGWVSAGVPGAEVHALLTDPQAPDFLLAATSAGLFRNGERIGPADPKTGKPAEVRSLALGAGGSLLVGGREWIFKSDDRTAYAGGPPVDVRVASPAIRSTDGGETWASIGALPWLLALKVDRGVAYAADLAFLHRSRDHGSTWEMIPPPPGAGFVNASALHVDPKGLLYVAFSGVLGLRSGVYRTANNGSSWELVGEGLRNAYVLTLTMDAAGDLYAGTEGGGLWKLDL